MADNDSYEDREKMKGEHGMKDKNDMHTRHDLEEQEDHWKFEANKKYFTICVYALVTFTIGVLIYRFISNWAAAKERIAGITSMLAPFLIAFLIIYFVTPMTKHIDQFLFGKLKIKQLKNAHKAVSLIISYAVIIGFLIAVITFIVPQIVTSISEMIVMIQNLINNFGTIFEEFQAKYPNIDLQAIGTLINDNMKILSHISEYMSSLIPMLYETGRSIVSWIVNIALAFVISCYLLWDKNGILNGLKRLVSVFFNERHSKIIFRTTKECNRIFSKYIIGKALDSLIIGILCFICMSILKLPYALLISVFVGITNMIPYFGPFIGAIPGVLLLLMVSPKMCIMFAILIFLLQQFDGSILGPKIIGNSTGLAPIGVIFGILVGGYVAGVVGMFIGVPVVAVLIYIINKLIDTHIYHRKLREDPNYVEPKFIMQMTDEELGFEYDAQE